MIATIIILALILLYCAWIIRRRVRQIRRGQFCQCCDGNCSCSCSCGKFIKK